MKIESFADEARREWPEFYENTVLPDIRRAWKEAGFSDADCAAAEPLIRPFSELILNARIQGMEDGVDWAAEALRYMLAQPGAWRQRTASVVLRQVAEALPRLYQGEEVPV